MSKGYVQGKKGLDYNGFKRFFINGNGKGIRLEKLDSIYESRDEASIKVVIFLPVSKKKEVYNYILKRHAPASDQLFGGWFFDKKLD